ncbi:AI-2E family transporter [Raoultibacter massiliensis]|uniref:AI-2E family transporter n=1 Tax=Raoultibacter massiliensis TaxID=1852371 RepID=A0ABV1JFZ7_9ACTN|nr:AI-2E family transporter [Raoultibacter massiliensis]
MRKADAALADDASEETPERERMLKARKRYYQVWTVVAAILLTGVFAYLMNVLSVPVGIVVWTCIIVFCLRTPVNRLEKLGLNRGIGTTIAYVLMFVVLIGLGALMFSPVFGVGDQFMNLVQSIPTYVQQITDWYNSVYPQYEHLFQNDFVKNWINDLTSSLGGWASETAKVSAEGIVTVGGTIANSFMVFGFAMVVAFWILMELPALGRECRRLIGTKHKEDAEMLHITFTRVMGGYIKATLVQCFLIGLACGIAFAIIGVPNYAALGGITGLLNIIPVVGPWLGGALAAIACVFVSPLVALIAVIVTIAIQQFVYTFVSPKLMSNSVDVHPALVIIALLAGSAIGSAMSGFMGGLVGMLASIPAVAVAKSVFVYYFEKRTGRRIVAKDGVFFKGTPTEKEGMLVDPLADMSSPEGAGRRRAHRREHARGPKGSAEREQGSQDGEPPASQGEKPESSQGSGSAGNEDD